jgi:hypothetical protein
MEPDSRPRCARGASGGLRRRGRGADTAVLRRQRRPSDGDSAHPEDRGRALRGTSSRGSERRVRSGLSELLRPAWAASPLLPGGAGPLWPSSRSKLQARDPFRWEDFGGRREGWGAVDREANRHHVDDLPKRARGASERMDRNRARPGSGSTILTPAEPGNPGGASLARAGCRCPPPTGAPRQGRRHSGWEDVRPASGVARYLAENLPLPEAVPTAPSASSKVSEESAPRLWPAVAIAASLTALLVSLALVAVRRARLR